MNIFSLFRKKRKFLYQLMPDTSSYFTISGGVVTTTSSVTFLQDSPLEWKNTDLKWTRNSKYHGVFRSFAIPLTFPGDGAHILRHVNYTQGFEGGCIIRIWEFNPANEEYDILFYEGDIDFSQAKDGLFTITVAVLDRGLAALLKAKETTPFEIPILSDALTVYYDRIKLQTQYDYLTQTGVAVGNTGFSLLANSRAYVPLQYFTKEGDFVGGTAQSQLQHQAQLLTAPYGVIELGTAMFQVQQAGTISLHWLDSIELLTFPSSNTNSFGMEAKVQARVQVVADNATTPYQNILVYESAVFATALQNDTGPFNAAFPSTTNTNANNISVNIGDRVFVIFVVVETGSHTGKTFTLSFGGVGDFYISQLFRDIPKPFKGYRYGTAWSKLIDAASDGLYTGQSSFLNNPALTILDNKPYNTVLTSGDAARGLTLNTAGDPSTPALLLTIDGVNKDAGSQWMTGIGVEGNVAKLEQLPYFYQKNTVIGHVGTIAGTPDIEWAPEYLFNLINVGYSNQTYDKLNGKDEFNTTSVFAAPVIRENSELNLIGAYRADMYGLEYVIAISDKKTTDSKSDNDTFIIEISDTTNGSGEWLLARKQNETGNSASGLIAADTAINLSMTSKHKLLRNGARLRAGLFGLDSKYITFQTNDKNKYVVSNLGSGTITENADVLISDLDAPLFLAIRITFETEVPTNLPTLINNNPYGVIGFYYRGDEYFGFIDEVGIKPSDNAVYQWKLLLHPDTDVSKLIHG